MVICLLVICLLPNEEREAPSWKGHHHLSSLLRQELKEEREQQGGNAQQSTAPRHQSPRRWGSLGVFSVVGLWGSGFLNLHSSLGVWSTEASSLPAGVSRQAHTRPPGVQDVPSTHGCDVHLLRAPGQVLGVLGYSDLPLLWSVFIPQCNSTFDSLLVTEFPFVHLFLLTAHCSLRHED